LVPEEGEPAHYIARTGPDYGKLGDHHRRRGNCAFIYVGCGDLKTDKVIGEALCGLLIELRLIADGLLAIVTPLDASIIALLAVGRGRCVHVINSFSISFPTTPAIS